MKWLTSIAASEGVGLNSEQFTTTQSTSVALRLAAASASLTAVNMTISASSLARAIEGTGGRYVDVAVMAPVDPARLSVPLLLSGLYAAAGEVALRALGFSNVRILPGEVGRASSVKMIRSVMVKGIEALTAEMMLAGDAAGVSGDVLASLGGDWPSKAAYNIERMTTHGARRAAEMEEVAKTLVALGIDPVMTRGTVKRQREMAA